MWIDNMSMRCLVATGVYLLIAALMIVLISVFRKDKVDVRALWLKFFVYVIIITAMLTGIWFGLTEWIALAISAGGLVEILLVLAKKGSGVPIYKWILSLLIYLFYATGFIFFGFAKTQMEDFLAFYTLIVVFDGFSQLSGQLFGSKKMTPRLSPGKTWEGLLGGMVMVIVTVMWIVGGSFLACVLIGVVFSLMALSGDLLASKFKRVFGIKDFSNLIPGHGGILDRFDSLMGAAALAMVGFLVYSSLIHGH